LLVCLSIYEMSFLGEVIVNAAVDGGELLQRLHLSEPEHRALSSSEGQVAVFHPIVGPAADLLFSSIAQLIHGGAVRPQAIGGDRLWRAVALQRLLYEAQGSRLVAGFGNVALEDLALVVDRAPQVHHLAVHLDVHLIEMPSPVFEAPHAADPLPADVGGEQRTEPVPPVPHRFMTDVDAALEQEVFDVAQAQRKPHVHHHDEADHLRRRVESAKRAGWQSSRFARHQPALASLVDACHVALTEPIRDIVRDEISWLIPAGRQVSMVAGDGQVELAFEHAGTGAASD
jgi:hypothetical protein